MDAEVNRAEPAHGDVVRRIRKHMGEPQVIVETRHAAKRYRLWGTVAMTARPRRAVAGSVTATARRNRCPHGCAAAAAASRAWPRATVRPSRRPTRQARTRAVGGRTLAGSVLRPRRGRRTPGR